jgi:hypothetical protein
MSHSIRTMRLLDRYSIQGWGTVRDLYVAMAILLTASLASAPAAAWGPDGHRSIGAIADRLIAGSNAAAAVDSILGGLSLRDASVWADCAKGVDPGSSYRYTAEGRFRECRIFQTPAAEAEMAEFVRRNDVNCERKASADSCHRQYHYTDVALQRDRYELGSVGARDSDLVAAVAAAATVLQGNSSPTPFAIQGKREALLLLAHYVGDIHQPLHVGAIYLSATGERIDPDAGPLDPMTETRGGNQISTRMAVSKKQGPNLHAVWDRIPPALNASHVSAAWVERARNIPATPGVVAEWPEQWGTETLGQAKAAVSGLAFGARNGAIWPVVLPASYSAEMKRIKTRQVTEAGARLAQMLQAIFP